MIIQLVRLKSNLSEEEMIRRAEERMPLFREVPGLIQKYYVKLNEPNSYGGFYIWDSRESLLAFKESELAASIPAAYEVMEPPHIEILEAFDVLRK